MLGAEGIGVLVGVQVGVLVGGVAVLVGVHVRVLVARGAVLAGVQVGVTGRGRAYRTCRGAGRKSIGALHYQRKIDLRRQSSAGLWCRSFDAIAEQVARNQTQPGDKKGDRDERKATRLAMTLRVGRGTRLFRGFSFR